MSIDTTLLATLDSKLYSRKREGVMFRPTCSSSLCKKYDYKRVQRSSIAREQGFFPHDSKIVWAKYSSFVAFTTQVLAVKMSCLGYDSYHSRILTD